MRQTNLFESYMKIKIDEFLKSSNFVDSFEKFKNDFYGAGANEEKFLKVMPYWSMIVGKLSVLSKEYNDVIKENKQSIARLNHSYFSMKNSDNPIHGSSLANASLRINESNHSIEMAKRKKVYVENIISDMKKIIESIDKEKYRKVASLVVGYKEKK